MATGVDKLKEKFFGPMSKLTAGDFIHKGKKVKFKFGEQEVACMEFSSGKQLMDSITDGMKKNAKACSPEVQQTFNQWFKGPLNDIKWVEPVAKEEVNKFGVYFGELFIGLLALEGKNTGITPCPWKGKKVSRFLVPTDTRFTGVDSFIELGDGEIIPISSKYGAGAKASFFANLLIKGIENAKELPKCVFRDIVQSALDIGVTVDHLEKKQKSKEILYEYGVRKILGLNKRQVKDSYHPYESIKNNKKDPDEILVITKIAELREAEQKIIDNLGESVTAFFSRITADKLNNDKKSIKVMCEILAGKNFWQANLQKADWDKGKVKFKLVSSGKAKLTMIGNKSAISDINGKQGTLNYELWF